MRKIFLALILLTAAFTTAGIFIHHSCEGCETTPFGWVSVAGYDSEGYLNRFTIPNGIASVTARHPLLGLTTLPPWAVGCSVAARSDQEKGRIAVILVFACVSALNVLLLWWLLMTLNAPLISRIAAILLWLSFAHVWILGGMAESFTLSATLLLGSLLMLAKGVKDGHGWLVMAIAAGGTTLTNGIKPVIAWWQSGAMGHPRDWWTRIKSSTNAKTTLCCLVAAACLAPLAFALKWQFVDKFGFCNGLNFIVQDIVEWLPSHLNLSFAQRMWYTWNSFFCEPIILHESIFAQEPVVASYASTVPHLLLVLLYTLCIGSAWINRHSPVIRAALLFFAFDFLLHVVIGWGINEGQIYCLHWLWLLPLLIAKLPKQFSWITIPLALSFAMLNVLEVASW